jgi:PAS domain S-box-containing protein
MSKARDNRSAYKLPQTIPTPGAFKHNEEIMQAILAQSIDAIMSIDQKGKIRLANPAAHEVFGIEQGGLLGRSLEEIVPAAKPDDLHKLCG